MKKICIVTATRAEYGLLRPIIQKFIRRKEYSIHVAVTGMHLSPEFGLTYKEIEADGIQIDKKIEILLSSDTPASISKSMALALIGFADYFEELRPDLVIVLGDRYETLSVASAAMNARIPIAHLYGGDVTEGAVDDAIRHSITKMSYLHFTATLAHRQRVIQMGESPERVFYVGAMAVENAKTVKLLSKTELKEALGFDWGDNRLAVVTFHPVTLEDNTAGEQCRNLLSALMQIESLNIIFTKANADSDGRIINQLLDDYGRKHPETCRVVASLGQLRYLSAVSLADVVIGNSSSGLTEVPCFHVPTVNIGDRQKGREAGKTVIHCRAETESIAKAIHKALSDTFRQDIKDAPNPYELEGTSDRIVEIISKELMTDTIELKKKFYSI
ncbi:MAG: UDP-N-acetylglucosamine 2-epimerase (hydrolyzing) [Lachnospiraceae bacterium]|nr:UDP-N-acetylglucosamine 2-epimerase (hydrolyzing) [Lachnospiraceae bacterium]